MRSLPRPLHSRNPSLRHISKTATRTCLWIPHSQISLGGTSVCLRGRDKRDREITAAVYGHIKAATETSIWHRLNPFLSLPLMPLKLDLILHHSGQLILLSGQPRKRRAGRSWNTANASLAVKQKNKSARQAPPFPANLFSLAQANFDPD